MNNRVQNVKLQSIMEWEIPQPLSIRPCQRPSEFKARQLNLYPLKLKKLPQWVNHAAFQPTLIKKQEQSDHLLNNHQNQHETQNQLTLQSKYKNRQTYQLRYQRGDDKYQFNQNFSHQYISTNYSLLEENKEKQRRTQQKSKRTNEQNEEVDLSSSQKVNVYDIQFDSRFECGNLSKAYQLIGSNEYHLIMQNDLNTLGYNQWYAFSVFNHEDQQITITIRIVNFVKQKSLYKKGMKPWFINQNRKCWNQVEGTCCYKKTNVRSESGDILNQLQFNINLPLGYTYIAMLPIYSYSRLCQNIKKWQKIDGMEIYNKKVYSLINNIVPLLEFIPNKKKCLSQEKQENTDKQQHSNAHQQQNLNLQTIVFFARIHPGQVWSSFLMEQVINTVIRYHKQSNQYEKQSLRYLFLPMLNPDGVIYGNFRCDFSGVDLNRVWIEPSKFTECSIYQIKKILSKQFATKKALYFIDLHSHSKAYNIFAYTSAESIQQSRLLSDILRLSKDNLVFDPFQQSSKLGNQFIKQGQTTFLSSKDIFLSRKKSTARAFMSRLTQKGRSMTVQISFYGYINKKDEKNPIKSFQLMDFKCFSQCLVKHLNHFNSNSSQDFVKVKRSLMLLYTNYLGQLSRESHSQNLNLLKKQNKTLSQENDLSEDSDSQPEKYYTKETKRIIKSKNGEVFDCRIVTCRPDKKSYMKQTESMIHKADEVKKDKTSSNTFQKSKIHYLKNKFRNKSKNDDLNKKSSISQYPLRTQSENKKKPSQGQNQSQNVIDGENSFNFNDKHNIFRKKRIFSKNKKERAQNASQIIENKKDLINNSVFEAMILDIEGEKKHEPIFGQFLSKSKRSASKRYKTVTKQQFSIFQAQMARLRKNDFKLNFKKKQKLPYGLSNFLEDTLYVADFSFPRTENHKNNVSVIQQPFENQNRQSRNSTKKFNDFYQSKIKRNGFERTNNFKNIYLFERKKIVEMMNKETRFSNVPQTQSNHFGQVQEIVDKRKRAKTQFDSLKDYDEKKSIFYHVKMNKIQKN